MFAQVLASVEQQFSKNVSAVNLSGNIKNQNELLRCFAELSKKLVQFLFSGWYSYIKRKPT
jgi:hypothetical protein